MAITPKQVQPKDLVIVHYGAACATVVEVVRRTNGNKTLLVADGEERFKAVWKRNRWVRAL